MANSRYLTRTPSVTGNRNKVTISFWAKFHRLDGSDEIISAGDATNYFELYRETDNTIRFSVIPAGRYQGSPAYMIRDNSKFYHFVVAIDTTQATAGNRVKMWINGVERTLTTAAGSTIVSQNANMFLNTSGSPMRIGQWVGDGSYNANVYLADLFYVDGQQLTASAFGQTNSNGQWEPLPPATVRSNIGSFGTNGFYLPFKNRASTTTLGYDYKTADRSSNNDFTPNFLSTSDGIKDGFGNTFPIMNYLSKFDGTLSEGGLVSDSINDHLATMGVHTGKWYWESKYRTAGTGGNVAHWGWKGTDYVSGGSSIVSLSGIHYRSDGNLTRYTTITGNTPLSNWSGSDVTGGTSVTTGDILGMSADLTSSPAVFKFFKNGTEMYSYTATYTFDGPGFFLTPFVRNNTGCITETNFGQGTFVTSNSGAGYSDANGYGKFQYQPPTGHLAICSENILDATVPNPGANFKVVSYTGNGSSQTVNCGFQPDMIWVKQYSGAAGWYWRCWDSNRGFYPTANSLYLNTVETEGTWEVSPTVGDYISGTTSTGFTVVTNGTSAGLNQNGTSFIAYCWKAGGVAVTNTAGTVSSQVSANTAAGFSIVKFTSPSSGTFTVGHGLGKKPALMISKARNGNTFNWVVYTDGMADTNFFRLNTADTVITTTSLWGGLNNINTNTIGFVAGNGVEASKNCIAYVWAQTPQFSKFGYYRGSNDTSVFVNCGFRPALVIIKPYITNTSVTTGWRVFDSVRNPVNTASTQDALYLNNESGNLTQNGLDMVGNGFTVINTNGDQNLNRADCSYFYMAFAESPFEEGNNK
jgi:hypothetical protein